MKENKTLDNIAINLAFIVFGFFVFATISACLIYDGSTQDKIFCIILSIIFIATVFTVNYNRYKKGYIEHIIIYSLINIFSLPLIVMLLYIINVKLRY